MTRTIITKVAGVTFDGRQEIISKLKGNEPCRISPEPSNKYDPNALAVHIAVAPGEIKHVGFVPRDLAAQIAPFLEGEQVMVRLLEIVGGFTTWSGERATLGLRIEIEIPDGLPTVGFLAGSETLADEIANAPLYHDEERYYAFSDDFDDDLDEGLPGWPGDYGDSRP